MALEPNCRFLRPQCRVAFGDIGEGADDLAPFEAEGFVDALLN